MRRLLSLIILFSFMMPAFGQGSNPAQAEAGHRIEKIINSNWTFNYFPVENADTGYESPGYDDSKWPLISIPHTWSTWETTGEIHPFIRSASETDNPYWWIGWGWYRKHFTIKPEYEGRKVFVEFEGVQKYCKVWINGKYLGDHKGGYGSFDFDITDHIIYGKENILAVAVNNRQKDQFRIPPMAAGTFNVYGGIYRDVTIVLKDKLYIPMQGSASHEGGTFVTTPSVSESEGIVRVQTWVRNDNPQPKNCRLNTYIIDASGKVIQVMRSKFTIAPGQMHKFDQTSKPVKNPLLWSPENPYLYRVHSEVLDRKTISDNYYSPLGFRWFSWDYKENFLYVNGKKTILHGGNRHQEYPWLGDAIPKWITEMDFEDIALNLNYNFMRTSHYPYDKLVYDLADRYGIIISEESPSIKKQDFSEEVQEQQMKEMIRRDRNHPSIMIWSMGNETNRAVDSNCERVELKVNGVSKGYKVPDQSNFHSVAFENILIEKGTVEAVATRDEKTVTTKVIMAGEPARIILKSSHDKITADRGSVVIITADIVDAEGNHIYGATNTIRWSVAGPATLAGHSIYESDIEKHHAMEGVWYLDMPVANVIRSTGKAGKIRVTVSSSGLASGSVEIDAENLKSEEKAIIEPSPDERGRLTVARPTFIAERLYDIPQEIKLSFDELDLKVEGKHDYADSMKEYIISNNPSSDTASVEFRTLIEVFVTHLVNNKGRLIADDYNFSVNHYNKCRLISGYIDATKLPPLFKEALREYYSDAIIRQGTEKDSGDEMNWLNWIPSGGTVVISAQKSTRKNWPAGTILTDKSELADLISVVYPVFANYGAEAKERALTFTAKMNPNIRSFITTETVGGKQLTKTIYTVEKDKPILIPLIKFISE